MCTKNIYYFNPEQDIALANGDPNFMPSATVRQMKKDLALLPIWYGDLESLVLAPSAQNLTFLNKIKKILPIQVDLITKFDLHKYEFSQIIPWGWNKSVVNELTKSGMVVTDKTNSFIKELKELSNRKTAVAVLESLRVLYGTEAKSGYYSSVNDLLNASLAYPLVLKAPLSGSGRGLQWCMSEISEPLINWSKRIVDTQGGIVVEKVLNKKEDFALEYRRSLSGKIEFVGYSLFETTVYGGYTRSILKTDSEIITRLSTFVAKELLEELRVSVEQQLTLRLIKSEYTGYLGVDCMIYQSACDDSYKIHPCVEINFRYTMGVVAHKLVQQWIGEGACGSYEITYFKKRREALLFFERMKRTHPLLIRDGRVHKGFLALNPVETETHYVAWILVQ